MTDTYPGSCLCGAVRFRISGPLSHMAHCHCSLCRKHHGAPFATYLAAPLAGYVLESGAEFIGRFDSSAGWYRPFCTRCGSVLWSLMPEYDVVAGPAGVITADLPIRAEQHMFYSSRVPWLAVHDDLPKHALHPPDMPGTPVPSPPLPEVSPGCTGGSCACGQVTYEYAGAPLRMLNCHCSRCRRARAAAHTTNLFVPLAGFRYSRGEALVQEFALPGARYFGVAFCRSCGSHVARRSLERQVAVIPAGGLDSDPGVAPSAHIFVGSKANWYPITDNLPQFAELPG